MKYLFLFVFLVILLACKKEKHQYPDGDRLPKNNASLTGVWILDAVYGSEEGPVTWIKVNGGDMITFTADSGYAFNKTLSKDRYLLSIYQTDTILKLYKKGVIDTVAYPRIDVFTNTLYIYYGDGIVPSGSKYIRH